VTYTLNSQSGPILPLKPKDTCRLSMQKQHFTLLCNKTAARGQEVLEKVEIERFANSGRPLGRRKVGES